MLAGGPAGVGRSLLATARALAVDGVTGEVVTAFRHAEIPTILLKGPTVACWLYDEGDVRYYMDSDLLVRPDRFPAAEQVLAALGFRRGSAHVPPPKGELPHAEPWHRAADGGDVDLHRTLSGLGVSPETGWVVLNEHTEVMEVGGVAVDVLQPVGRTLLVALHAAQHGPAKVKPLEDLRRALDRVPLETWDAASALAGSLHAVGGFASGLRLLPRGERVADRLHLAAGELVATATRPGSPARVALGFERLAQERGLLARVQLLRREVFPSRSFLRWWSPLARRGRLGLAIVYVWRPLWLLWHAWPSLRAWRRSRSAPGRSRPC